MSDKIIRAKNVSFTYNLDEDEEKKYVLKNIDLEIEKGTFISIIGQNGSGKSTLAKLFNSILVPSIGELTIFGHEIKKDIDDDEIYEIRKKIGMVFQNPDNQLVATIVEEDIAFGPENLGIPPKEIRERVDDALKIVGMSEYSRHSASQLSGGQKQRVAIAGIIALNPEAIIFDESTAMLDPIGRMDVLSVILKLKESGKTIILITHHMDEAALADRVIVLNKGEIILDGTPKEVFAKEDVIKENGLDVPQAKLVLDLVKDSGYNIDNEYLDEVSAAKEIDRLIKGSNNG